MPEFERLLFGDRRDPRDELAAIFDAAVPTGGEIQPAALAWARGILAEQPAGVDVVEAIALLRRAEPRLGLKSARYLAERAAAG
ncbi:hypothetical protein [Compostimonas suwonensis]|uniref:Uncharacterized protein n=1 Tax=Compostimonas suwonensis TaxID=1048394 RepID=A0A2M9BBW3_9MICO|nr:hypothetical protein [Compostimonas suwonensis]PJJ55428.1 hypothetical protein CLV54_2771 [Compostimonas suwonensis]